MQLKRQQKLTWNILKSCRQARTFPIYPYLWLLFIFNILRLKNINAKEDTAKLRWVIQSQVADSDLWNDKWLPHWQR